MLPKRSSMPDSQGFFGEHGGSYVAEPLMLAVNQLQDAYKKIRNDKSFFKQLDKDLEHYVGRPSPIYLAHRLSKKYGCQIALKREDLNHTGSHKINNALGQVAIAKQMGKTRIIAETGAGQHGVATATACARVGLPCFVYMGATDIKRQAPNVARMKLLGAEVIPVNSGTSTLKDALNEALRDWVANVKDTFYVIGSVAGPHPYPQMVRDMNSVIGRECIKQMDKQFGHQPDIVVACVGGGSNAIGIFNSYLDTKKVKLYGVEAGGDGLKTGKHAAPLASNAPRGILHGMSTYVMQDKNGQVCSTSSVSAGLDYPAVGPEHAWLRDTKRVNYVAVTDKQVLQAFHDLAHYEGILPALESAHAVAYAKKLAAKQKSKKIILINLSGRGDKDLATVLSMQS